MKKEITISSFEYLTRRSVCLQHSVYILAERIRFATIVSLRFLFLEFPFPPIFSNVERKQFHQLPDRGVDVVFPLGTREKRKKRKKTGGSKEVRSASRSCITRCIFSVFSNVIACLSRNTSTRGREEIEFRRVERETGPVTPRKWLKR